MGSENFRPLEKESLKIDEARFLGLQKFFAGLDFLRQKAVPVRTMVGDEFGSLASGIWRTSILMMSANSTRGSRESDSPKIIQRDQVTGFFQPPASGDDQVVGWNGFQNLRPPPALKAAK